MKMRRKRWTSILAETLCLTLTLCLVVKVVLADHHTVGTVITMPDPITGITDGENLGRATSVDLSTGGNSTDTDYNTITQQFEDDSLFYVWGAVSRLGIQVGTFDSAIGLTATYTTGGIINPDPGEVYMTITISVRALNDSLLKFYDLPSDPRTITIRVYDVFIGVTGISLEDNNIEYILSPSGLTGDVTLKLIDPDEDVILNIQERDSDDSPFAETLGVTTLESVEEHEKVYGEWVVNGIMANSEYDFHIKVLGLYDHTCYITADAADCKSKDTVFTYSTGDCVNTQCDSNNGSGRKAWLNAIDNPTFGAGSGVDLANDIWSQEHFCSTRLRATGALCPSCETGLAVGNVAIAIHTKKNPHPHGLVCEDTLWVYQNGTHVVKDTGSAVATDQLDHYANPTGCSACTAIGDNIMTIKIAGTW